MREFRIVKISDRFWRIDQRHSILFGLIKWWDNGSYDLSPYYNFSSLERALEHLTDEYGYCNFKYRIKNKKQ